MQGDFANAVSGEGSSKVLQNMSVCYIHKFRIREVGNDQVKTTSSRKPSVRPMPYANTFCIDCSNLTHDRLIKKCSILVGNSPFFVWWVGLSWACEGFCIWTWNVELNKISNSSGQRSWASQDDLQRRRPELYMQTPRSYFHVTGLRG